MTDTENKTDENKPAKPAKSKKASKQTPYQRMNMINPAEVIIIGLDTKDASEHYLYDPRIELPLDEALVLNIMEFGVLEPVIVNKHGEVVDGRQRTRAAREANKRLAKKKQEPVLLPTIEKQGKEGRLFGMSQATFIRQDESILQKAEKVARYLDMGHTEDDAAVAFGATKTAIKQWLSVLALPSKIVETAKKKNVSDSALVELAKLKPEDADEALKEMIAKGDTSVKAAKGAAVKKKATKAGKPAETVTTNPSMPKRKIQKVVLAANRLYNEDPKDKVLAALEEGLDKEPTLVDVFLLGMRVACGDRDSSTVKGLNALINEATGG